MGVRSTDEFFGELCADVYEKVCQEGKRIAAEIFRDDMPDVVKAYVANEYLARHVRYDMLWYDQGYYGVKRIPACDRTMEGPFINQVAVCAGIAKAYCYLMSLAGVPCWYITGEIKQNGGGHAWNLIRLGGEMYHVDVTWNLGQTGWCDGYFLLSDAQMRETRTWNAGIYPKCKSNFYKARGHRDMVTAYRRRHSPGAAGVTMMTGVPIGWRPGGAGNQNPGSGTGAARTLSERRMRPCSVAGS